MERIEVMWRDDIIASMEVDYKARTINLINYIDDWIKLPFGKLVTPTWEDYQYMLSTRVFPRERGNSKLILKIIGVDEYDPDLICRKTHGVMFDDYMWFRYPGEKVTFDDVKVRN